MSWPAPEASTEGTVTSLRPAGAPSAASRGVAADRREGAAGPDEVLRVEGVSVRLGGRQVLRDVTFSIRAGEVAGLIGSNGAGKTTLLRVILGLAQPEGGRVLVCGEPRDPRRRLLGYLPQKVVVDDDLPLRARDVVGLGVDGHRLGIPLARRRRRELVEEMLRAVDATAFADVRMGHLSGGQQQRVLIAHALAARPRLLLLDEPLASLDPASAQDIVGLLSRLADDHGVSVLVSAHEMNPLLPVMDRVVYVAGGKVASGPVAEVVRSDVLSALYGGHVDVLQVHGRVLVVTGEPPLDGPGRLEPSASPHGVLL